MGRSGARFPHTTLPEKFEMWKLKNADLGMFHKVLQCNGQNFGIDLRSLRATSGRGRGRGYGGARTSPSLPPSGKLGIYGFRNAVSECFIRCFFRKVNLIHLGIIFPIIPFNSFKFSLVKIYRRDKSLFLPLASYCSTIYRQIRSCERFEPRSHLISWLRMIVGERSPK